MTTRVDKVIKKELRKKRLKIGGFAAAISGMGLAGLLTFDFITKRVSYPERNVVYTVTQEVKIAGGEESHGQETSDRRITANFFKGSVAGRETTAEDLIATSVWDASDKVEKYELRDKHNIRIAYGYLKNEYLQPGPSIRGRMNWQEQFAILDPHPKIENATMQSIFEDDTRDAFFIWRHEPERGRNEVEIDALRINGQKKLINRLIDVRFIPLGWLWGQNYRAGTILEKYNLPESDPLVKKLFDTIREYNKVESIGAGKRIALIEKIAELEKSIPKIPIYNSFEEGFIDTNFQESTVWLGYHPSLLERVGFRAIDTLEEIKNKLTLTLVDKNVHREGVLRVENHWDFFPGNIPLLNKLRYSTPTRIFSLFDKTNNGGYELIDEVGTVAKVEIKDFWLHYDNALLYKYFLDKNGDGKIDKKNELIGQVLFRVARGEKLDLDKDIGEGKSKKDVTQQYEFVFMGGKETDAAKRYEDFLLSTYVESTMSDALNRGFGKHSVLGWINYMRGDLILFEGRKFYDVSRSLNVENSMVAGHDIYMMLKAAKRPFAEKFGKIIDIEHDLTMTDGGLYVPTSYKPQTQQPQPESQPQSPNPTVQIKSPADQNKEPAAQNPVQDQIKK